MIGRVRITPLDDLKAYMKWHLVHSAATRLPDSFADATFELFDRTLGGQEAAQPRWRECVADTDQQLGEALGKAFVEEAFSAEAKADMLRMVWEEKNGPAVEKPVSRGFGTRSVIASIESQLGGQAEFDWRSEGLVCRLSVPLMQDGAARQLNALQNALLGRNGAELASRSADA